MLRKCVFMFADRETYHDIRASRAICGYGQNRNFARVAKPGFCSGPQKDKLRSRATGIESGDTTMAGSNTHTVDGRYRTTHTRA